MTDLEILDGFKAANRLMCTHVLATIGLGEQLARLKGQYVFNDESTFHCMHMWFAPVIGDRGPSVVSIFPDPEVMDQLAMDSPFKDKAIRFDNEWTERLKVDGLGFIRVDFDY